jgi:TRAP-type C4-dicarboxylate transport system permease small subunit
MTTNKLPESTGLGRWLNWLRHGANHVQVAMMAVMFISFILQIFFRYVLNKPVAWTDEVCVITWTWGILWGASFVMRNREDIRFDVLTSHVSRPVKRGVTVLASVAIVAILIVSMPATWSYITFMKVEDSASLGIRMDLFFSIYLAFAAAMIVRHTYIGIEALRGRLYDDDDATVSVAAKDAA